MYNLFDTFTKKFFWKLDFVIDYEIITFVLDKGLIYIYLMSLHFIFMS